MDAVQRLGLSALIGGAGLVVANVLLVLNPDARDFDAVGDYLAVGVLAAAVLLTLAGLVGVHLRQRDSYGRLGRVGMLLALVGEAAVGVASVRLNEWVFLVTAVTGLVGFVLLAVAIARAPALPHWSGFLLLVGFVALFAVGDGDFGIALSGVVWLVIGYALRSGWTETAPAARPLQARPLQP